MSSNETPNRRNGVSLRSVHRWLIIGAVIISVLLFHATYQLSSSFRSMAATSELQIELRKAARELMDASDYLTENVQRFTVKGDTRFMEAYFNEANVSRRREDAIDRMSVEKGSAAALERLQSAMEGSLALMEREYYAMRLVIEARGIEAYPEALQSVALSDEDRALDPEDKMRLATEMVLGDEYYREKDVIRENMRASLDELEEMAYSTDARALDAVRKEMQALRVVIVVQILAVVFMVWLTSRLGIHPVLNAVERIKEDSPIPEVGANEFRYLARTYNKMYEVYKRSLERLNFKASHDALTGAYNRSGYELILSSIDLKNTYMMMFDLDNFKEINDTFGHEAGDRVLAKTVNVLKRNFRSDDYVCRIGGDEFIVFMVHATKSQEPLIAAKVEKINRELRDVGDGLPATSASVGIAHGLQAVDTTDLFEKTDAALYASKQRGKQTYTFSAA